MQTESSISESVVETSAAVLTTSTRSRNANKTGKIEFSKPTLTRNELKSVLETLIQDNLGAGATVVNLEKEFAKAFEFEKALAVHSHTSAYHLAFLSCGIKPGDEIILSTNAPLAALDAATLVNAQITLLDLDRNSFHTGIEQFAEAANEKTAAILVNYPFGSFSNFSELKRSIEAKENIQSGRIQIIQDISGLAGAEVAGSMAGSDADIAILGMHEDHMLTIGKGGVIMTDSASIYSIAKDLRMHGGSRPYRLRFDYALTDYQAAMALEQLSLLPSLIERRKKIAMHYLDAVKNSRCSTWFDGHGSDAYTAFPLVTEQNIEHTQRYFSSLGIETRRVMPMGPLHSAMALPGSAYQNAEKLYQRGVLLPLYPNLTRSNVERICAAIRTFY
ncbi:MAG: DegT/DnrJ/EryC1/StrS family aminotransferase [Leptospiraceae bacterium]|nr:DegT/DnrJ/EryC1/StrS family aminotransferase [Leptospiraceae bacterium]